MLAGVLYGERDLRVEEVNLPEPGPGQLLLRVHQAGICGSDVHYFSHGRCGPFVPTRPFILGHEFVATVEDTGTGVDHTLVGQRVVVNPAYSCGHCEQCTSGRGNLCLRVSMLGSASTTPPTDGAFAQYTAVQAHQCYPIPQTMENGIAALMEPLSVVLHAISRSGGVDGSRVLVTGGGPIGLLIALTAQAMGASTVVVSEPSLGRRQLAESMGVDHVLDPGHEDRVSIAKEMSDGGFEIVFEASGAQSAVKLAMKLARRGGTIVQIGTVGDNYVSLPVNDLMLREIAFLGTFRYANEFPKAIRLAASSRLAKLHSFITAVYPLKEMQQAMELACGGGDSLKVQMVMED